MTKAKTKYICNSCGAATLTWSGKCNSCGEWNSMIEQVEVSTSRVRNSGHQLDLKTIREELSHKEQRFSSGIEEVDSVLGGGFVCGGVVLLAGEPGIGKSTILMQIAGQVAKTKKLLYVSGEESAHQVASRARRLGVNTEFLLVSSNSANDVASTMAEKKFDLVIVDSIQTMTVSEIASSPGSVAQVNNSTQLLTVAAKQSNSALVIVGHVTKEGSIAGPKVLEHTVDAVLQLEGDRFGGFKLLRSIKNRYGSTNEIGIFEMTEVGLRSVANPSAALLAERQKVDGSVIFAGLQGTRPILVEIQALVNKTNYGYPKRAASGLDVNRMNLLIAMLERRTKINLAEKDIYINVVGGLKLTDPSADLAVCMAIASADKTMVMNQDAVVFGEVGLSGEVRHVPFIAARVEEAAKLGFMTSIGPKYNEKIKKGSLESVVDVKSALNRFLSQ
jgi:DNA repair protein RadA/Sms